MPLTGGITLHGANGTRDESQRDAEENRKH
jgi:hypothetical protein